MSEREEVRHDSIAVVDVETINEFQEAGYLEQTDLLREMVDEPTAAVEGYSVELHEAAVPTMEVDYKYLVEKPESPLR